MGRTHQIELFARSPRARPRKLMHVYDYGDGWAYFKCAHCGHDSGWVKAGKLSDDKRGRPCPECNSADGRTHDEMPGRTG